MPKEDYFQAGQLTDLVYLVLLTLTQPSHGYMIMQRIETLTDGEVIVGPASLYTTVKKLTDKGYIKLVDTADNKKVYSITDIGRLVLQIEIDKRKKLALYGERALKGFDTEEKTNEQL